MKDKLKFLTKQSLNKKIMWFCALYGIMIKLMKKMKTLNWKGMVGS